MLRDRRSNESPRAEPGNCEPGDHAAFIGEPLDQSCHGHDVTQTKSDAAEDAVGQVEQSEVAADLSSQHHAQAVAEASDERDSARTDPLHP